MPVSSIVGDEYLPGVTYIWLVRRSHTIENPGPRQGIFVNSSYTAVTSSRS